MNFRSSLLLLLMMSFMSKDCLSANIHSLAEKAKNRYEDFNEKVTDITFTYNIELFTQMLLKSKVKTVRKGNKYRVETRMDPSSIPDEMKKIMGGKESMEHIVIYDGENLWMISSTTGKTKMPMKEERKFSLEYRWWDYGLDEYKIMGKETVEGRECHVIGYVSDNDNTGNLDYNESPSKLWVDVNKMTVMKLESGMSGSKIAVHFSDFRKLEKIEIPGRIMTYTGEKLISSAVLESFEYNKGVDDSIFDPGEFDGPELDYNEIMKQMMQKDNYGE